MRNCIMYITLYVKNYSLVQCLWLFSSSRLKLVRLIRCYIQA